MKKKILLVVCLIIVVNSLIVRGDGTQKPLAPTPPMGWNSFDSYRLDIHEQACLDNLKTFVEVFKPLGYEYFVIDAGWYNEYKLRPGSLIPVEEKGKVLDVNLDKYGYLIPSKCFFPNGLKPIADECRKHGVKLGVHIMRGIPRKAVELNTPVKGTNYSARDIADTGSICVWCPLNYGVDMTKPGSQEYYDGFIRQLADYGVDFIKADDIVEFPAEIEAVLKAIEKSGRPILLSLSPGDRVLGNEIRTYEKADMLRVTGDVWDRQFDIEKSFASWLTWQYVPVREGFWFDMDMIPFGELRVTIPKDTPDDKAGHEGKHRFDNFTVPQKETFITMRALSASPLFMGGVLPTLDKESLRLLTSREMISCNQNGKIGHMVEYRDSVQTWLTEKRGAEKESGWAGVFNRSGEKKMVHVSLKSLGLDPDQEYNLYDIWGDKPFKPGQVVELEPHGCVFLRYIRQMSGTISVDYDSDIGQLEFAAEHVRSALKDAESLHGTGQTAGPIELRINPGQGQPESFTIRRDKSGRIRITGVDAAGAMYGGLEAAELIRIAGPDNVRDDEQRPYMAMRGVKFNCPLDVRSPSYTDVCDSAQQNIGEMWSFDFWKEFIDTLAAYRYNYVSLWNLHPFPSMVKVPEYPDVALADVKRSTGKFKEYYTLQGQDFDAPEIVNNTETLKTMSIEEKIAFWQKVMRYGRQRNVNFYVVTWNIFTYGVDGKYGITNKIDNPITIDYFRKSVKQMFLTYPDLAGIGLTTGENMYGNSFAAKEDWALATYGQGVLDALKESPGRKITFIHRQHETGALDIAKVFKPIVDHPDIRFTFSFKYAQAHVYSCTKQSFHQKFIKELQSQGDLKTIWTLRNDDIYQFRWGAPDFVREFVQNIPRDVSLGYYYGSDQWIWGREFLSKNPRSPRQLEIDKHWYQWMLWGRLGYNPNISNQRFTEIIQKRFPATNAGKLFEAWQAASMVYPLTTGYHWGSLDFQWYIEGCKSTPESAQTETGFHDVNRFITLKPHPSTGYVSIPDYVKLTLEGKGLEGAGPLDISAQLHQHADQALDLLKEIVPGRDAELKETLQDIETISYLGKYYAHKIHGAADLHMYRKSENKKFQQEAVSELKKAADYWRLYVNKAKSQYINPLWTNRVGYVKWEKLTQEADKDIEIAGADTPVSKSAK